ncbi:MAG: peptidase M16 [Desulfobacterales bacterium]|nr:MAG: peptidase M16 [Desulfobacterales bacterium]
MTTHNGSSNHGFLLKKHEYNEEIAADVFLFEHEVVGCPLFAIKNKDDNKTFSVAFNTIPEDSTGVAHILEHSVLMGSKKYPIKDVFGEVNKGGLMTFLNAMTGADITYYPFATRNLKEYFNLMDVYCDVVFNPLLRPETFEQEGWHYHKEKGASPIQFQGVVFNEMKGAFSDPTRLIFHHVFAGLMPGSTYAHESGGDPQCIPDLSYEQFYSFHQYHYHPTNATFFLYGDAPLDEELGFINDRFLKTDGTVGIRKQVNRGKNITEPVFIEDTYGIESGDIAEKTFLAVGTHVGSVAEREKNAAFQVIANILYNSDGSPLKNRIVSRGICKDFGGLYLSASCFNTIMLTYLIGSEREYLSEFQSIYQDTLQEMVSGKLDRDLVVSELNKFEFTVREDASKAQRGLDLIDKALAAFKYDTDPFETLKVETLLRNVRKKALEQNYFEQLIETHLITNPATVTVTLSPDPDQQRRTAEKERNRLSNYEKTLTEKQQEQLIARTRELSDLQQAPNPPEMLAQLPHLSISDLPVQVPFHSVTEAELAGHTFLINNLPTNRITYCDIGFDFSRLPHRYLPLLDLFGSIITEIGTEKLDYMAFAKEAGICTGGIKHAINTYAQKDTPDQVRLVFWISLKTLPEFLERAIDLLAELFSGVSFAHQDRIKEIVRREFAWTEHAAQSEGYSLPATRVLSHLGIAGRYQEQFAGITAYRTIKTLIDEYEKREYQLLEDLQQMAKILLNRDNLIISITGEEKEIESFSARGKKIIESLPDTVYPVVPVIGPPSFPASEAFITAAEVVFAVQGMKLLPEGKDYHGSLEVLKTYLSRDYLWNTVRQMGGAYGCFIQFNHITGTLAIVSYRDPQVRKTYEAYERLPEVIANIDLSAPVLEQLIIGTYGSFDPHQSSAVQGATARNEFLSGIDQNQKQQRLEEITATTVDDMKSYAPRFSALAQERLRAIIGNRNKIENDKDLFDQISSL